MIKAQFVKSDNHAIDVIVFRKELIVWGQKHFRSFPWRMTKDPYYILMAEVMLHRTQAAQVVPVYEKFIERFPDIKILAQTNKEELHDLLCSLGLRWRIDLIYTMVAELADRFGGHIPQQKSDLLSLSGVSDYIASALYCFAWNQPEPLMDTNTVRVIGRLFDLEIKDSSRRNRRFRELITALMDPDEPSAYYYALLDLADQVCTKKRPPECIKCPIQKHCAYGINALAASVNDQTGETNG
jgi:A/G-specific adenine glycosylase